MHAKGGTNNGSINVLLIFFQDVLYINSHVTNPFSNIGLLGLPLHTLNIIFVLLSGTFTVNGKVNPASEANVSSFTH